MANIILPEAEKIYIIHGIQENIRSDGRSNLDYRTIELETDVIANCNGSCLLKIADTKLLAGVKAELTTPPASSPDKGWIEVSIESTPHAHLDFEGRGGDDFSSEISHILTKVCNNDKLVDLKSLCVIPGQQVWVLYVDIMVLGYGGNFIDAAAIATKAALYDTKIQSVSVKNDGENEPEIVVSDDPYDVFSLDVKQLPLLTTLYRIGNEFIIDATREEETCCICKLVLGVSLKETVMMKQIAGFGSLHIESIKDAIEVGQEIGMNLQKQLLESLEREKILPKKKKCLF
ncbi:exosome complex component RRP42-like [Argiope bruennichi]|uniref:Ribosomal RNA-processing protein 42 n=1 Tax=Argiope bruennichi TaxID=94029 RepID=A0A8T0FXS9_ARGBR|nr:exosome complex component RRP42-like [Argiope bruennichi]KAF8795904.1 Exosome complex component RRP42 like protein [Argiope bruennichi]